MLRAWSGLTFAILVLTAFPGASGTVAAPVPPPRPVTPRWMPLLEWLPEDTETLIVAPLGFEVPKQEPESTGEQIDYSQSFQFLPTGPLSHLQDGLLHKELVGQKVLWAVEGSRRFRSPGELGMMPYE